MRYAAWACPLLGVRRRRKVVIAAIGTAAASKATEEAIHRVADVLTGGRSVILEIDNNTPFTLYKIDEHHDHGGWGMPPKDSIPSLTRSGATGSIDGAGNFTSKRRVIPCEESW
jgi:hypothetical protein